MAVMLLAGLQTVPRELIEAAAIDGAGRWHTFWRLTVPHLRSIIGTVLLITGTMAFSLPLGMITKE
ncbi:MAG: sugar ABC transporter permease, partial [Anaerolineaceae bacterium]|nr:sugar ABC transporter permease [Anaerolineaceae bacterium]